VCTDRSDGAIVESVVRLAHGLGMTVTAEGVEEAAQQGALRALDSDHLQGFRFGSAMCDDELLALLRSQRRLRAA
jgi:EAL domain-containing protein (putative c-di-GMP-specific phosphodiesterase class I)